MKKIPLNSLCLLFTNSNDIRKKVERKFLKHEVITLFDIKNEILGPGYWPNYDYHIMQEFQNRIKTKLNVGRRVLVSDSIMTKSNRIDIARLAKYHNIPIFYIFSHSDIKKSKLDEGIKHGDYLAEIINLDLGMDQFELIKPYNKFNLEQEAKTRGYHGITLIPDIHGMKESAISAITWAKQQNNLIIFLGDIIDYGPSNKECVDLVYDLVIRGQALNIIGNHEFKIFKWLQNEYLNADYFLNISKGNQVTINELEGRNERERQEFLIKMSALFAHGSYHLRINQNVAIAHAGYNNSLFSNTYQYPKGSEEKLLIFGQINTNKRTADDKPTTVYNWVDELEEGKTVFVGHNIRSYANAYEQIGVNGARVIFLDTGCGKGGPLSTADISLSPVKLRNFNRH